MLTIASSFAFTMCPAPAPPPPPAPPLAPTPTDCSATDINGTATSRAAPFVVQAGCPVTVSFAGNERVYLAIERDTSDSTLTFEYELNAMGPVGLFTAWNAAPLYAGLNSYYDRFLPLNLNDQVVFARDQTGKGNDIYHDAENRRVQHGRSEVAFPCGGCDAAPCKGGSDSHTGKLFLTLQSQGASVAGTVTFGLFKPSTAILQPELEALRDLHRATCAPSQAKLPIFHSNPSHPNHRWHSDRHSDGFYSLGHTQPIFHPKDCARVHPVTHDRPDLFNTTGAEKDYDRLPFCDWLYGVDVESTTDCTQLDGVTCDEDGHVVELHLAGRALAGPLPTSFASALTKLRYIDLHNNQLTGVLPATLLDSTGLTYVDVGHNHLSGPIPCPTDQALHLQMLALEYNEFSGAMPACLFTRAPALSRLFLRNVPFTPAPLPPTIKQASRLTLLYAEGTGLTGAVPPEVGCLRNLVTLDLSHNELSGRLPAPLMGCLAAGACLKSLYRFDLSYNHISGAVPTFSTAHSALQIVDLQFNDFSGDVTKQFEAFSASRPVDAFLMVQNNRLSGELPVAFSRLATSAKRIGHIDISGNRFRCDGNTGSYAQWARRVPRYTPTASGKALEAHFGRCERVPILTGASHFKVGEPMIITGEHFTPSDELRCRLGATTFAAAYVSPTTVTCVVPDDVAAGAGPFALSVANYGDDFSAEGALEVTLDHSPPPPPPSSPPAAPPSPAAPPPLPSSPPLVHEVAKPELVGGLIGALAGAALLVSCVAILVRRERIGKPVFEPIVSVKRVEAVKQAAAALEIAVVCTTPTVSHGSSSASSRSDSPVGSRPIAPFDMAVSSIAELSCESSWKKDSELTHV